MGRQTEALAGLKYTLRRDETNMILGNKILALSRPPQIPSNRPPPSNAAMKGRSRRREVGNMCVVLAYLTLYPRELGDRETSGPGESSAKCCRPLKRLGKRKSRLLFHVTASGKLLNLKAWFLKQNCSHPPSPPTQTYRTSTSPLPSSIARRHLLRCLRGKIASAYRDIYHF